MEDWVMEQKVVVLHEGALAQYSFTENDEGVYILWLRKYKAEEGKQPPAMFIIRKEGRRWHSEGHPQELIDDIGYAIEQQ